MLLFSTKFPSEIATALPIATSTLLTEASRYIQWALYFLFIRARSKYRGWKPSRRGAASYFYQNIVQQSWNEYGRWSNQSWQPGADRREKLRTSYCHSSVVKDYFKNNSWLYLEFKDTFKLDTKYHFYLAWILGRVHTRNILFRQWLKKLSLLIKTIKCLSKGNKLMCLESRKHFALRRP